MVSSKAGPKYFKTLTDAQAFQSESTDLRVKSPVTEIELFQNRNGYHYIKTSSGRTKAISLQKRRKPIYDFIENPELGWTDGSEDSDTSDDCFCL